MTEKCTAPAGWVYADEIQTYYQIQSRIKDYLKIGEKNPWRDVREYLTFGTAEDDLLTFFPDSPICEYRIREVTSRVLERAMKEETTECDHEWAYTGTAYGGDDESYHGEGRCYCIHCGADGDG